MKHQKAAKVLIAVVLIAVLAVALAVTAIFFSRNHAVEPPTPSPDQPTVEVEVPDEVVNILLLGMDARNYEDLSRSDSMILVSYNQTKNEVRMVSFMRDSWVHIPDHGWNRLNTATVFGGIDLLMDTLNENFDVQVEDYVQIKFDDFKKVIDIIGGIDVDLTSDEIWYINHKLHTEDNDWSNDITSEAGVVHLNGAQALWHCRDRTIGQADYARTKRQRTVLKAVCEKVLNDCDAKTMLQLVSHAFQCVNTEMSVLEIGDLAVEVLTQGMPEIEDARVPFDEMYQGVSKNGASVLELDMEANRDALQEFLTQGWTHFETQVVSE